MFRGSESLDTVHTIMAGIVYVSEGAFNQEYWRVGMVAKIEKNLGGKSTFFTKRECLCFW
jgi:hypothetical protein